MRPFNLMSSLRVGLISNAMLPHLLVEWPFLRSLPVFGVVLADEFLVKTDKVLCVNAGHEFPTEVECLFDGSVFVAGLSKELVLKDTREVKQLLVTFVERVFADDGDQTTQFTALSVSGVHLVADLLVVVTSGLLADTGTHQPR